MYTDALPALKYSTSSKYPSQREAIHRQSAKENSILHSENLYFKLKNYILKISPLKYKSSGKSITTKIRYMKITSKVFLEKISLTTKIFFIQLLVVLSFPQFLLIALISHKSSKKIVTKTMELILCLADCQKLFRDHCAISTSQSSGKASYP